MVLQDNKQTAYLVAGVAMVVGLLICVFFIRRNVVPVIVGLGFIGFGALILFKTKRVTIELDRATATMHILLQGLNSKEDRNLSLGQIQKLTLRTMIETHTMNTSAPAGARYQGGGNTRTSSTTYHRFILSFVTNENEEIPFEFGKVKVGLMNALTNPEEKIQRDAQQVASFLKVPLDTTTPSAPSGVLGALRAGLAGKMQKVH